MTEQALEEGNNIHYDLERLQGLMKDIRPYLGHETYITIRTNNDRVERKFTLTSNSPLYVAIQYALDEMEGELKKKFKDLDCNLQTEYHSRPIERTSIWKKIWGKR